MVKTKKIKRRTKKTGINSRIKRTNKKMSKRIKRTNKKTNKKTNKRTKKRTKKRTNKKRFRMRGGMEAQQISIPTGTPTPTPRGTPAPKSGTPSMVTSPLVVTNQGDSKVTSSDYPPGMIAQRDSSWVDVVAANYGNPTLVVDPSVSVTETPRVASAAKGEPAPLTEEEQIRIERETTERQRALDDARINGGRGGGNERF